LRALSVFEQPNLFRRRFGSIPPEVDRGHLISATAGTLFHNEREISAADNHYQSKSRELVAPAIHLVKSELPAPRELSSINHLGILLRAGCRSRRVMNTKLCLVKIAEPTALNWLPEKRGELSSVCLRAKRSLDNSLLPPYEWIT
jgi:hypothetical protein